MGAVKAKNKKPLVWGSGSMSKIFKFSPILKDNVHLVTPDWNDAARPLILSVRGPLTRLQVMRDMKQVPMAIGDPGTMFYHLYPRHIFSSVPPIHEICLILHYIDQKRSGEFPKNMHRVDITAPFMDFIKELVKCRRIVATTLHGVITAHSYRIPTLPIRIGEAVAGHSFKFDDYFRGGGLYLHQHILDLPKPKSLTLQQYITRAEEFPIVDPTSLLERQLSSFPLVDSNPFSSKYKYVAHGADEAPLMKLPDNVDSIVHMFTPPPPNPLDTVSSIIAEGKETSVVQKYQGSARLAVVIGTGRSGTNWLGSTIASHPQVVGGKEREPEFTIAKKIGALEEYTKWNRLIATYVKRLEEADAAKANWYVDKGHPLIWAAEKLAKEFPSIVFFGIDRCIFSIVSSCMDHIGVRKWFEDERLLTKRTSPFLGKNEKNSERFNSAPLYVQCAWRAVSHRNEYDRLQTVLKPSQFVRINYQDLQEDYTGQLQHLASKLDISDVGWKAVPPKIAAVDKWRKALSPAQINEIVSELKKDGLFRDEFIDECK